MSPTDSMNLVTSAPKPNLPNCNNLPFNTRNSAQNQAEIYMQSVDMSNEKTISDTNGYTNGEFSKIEPMEINGAVLH